MFTYGAHLTINVAVLSSRVSIFDKNKKKEKRLRSITVILKKITMIYAELAYGPIVTMLAKDINDIYITFSLPILQIRLQYRKDHVIRTT